MSRTEWGDSVDPPNVFGFSEHEHNLWWVMEVLYHYQFTGDLELIKVYPNMKKSLAWYDKYRDKYGLLCDAPSTYPYIQLDYAYKGGHDIRGEVAVLNCLYYEALRCLCEMAELFSEEKDAEKYREDAGRAKNAINERLWSDETGGLRRPQT